MIIRVDHADAGSVDYMADVIVAGDDRPPVRAYVNGMYVPTTQRNPHFVVIEVNWLERRYCGAPDGRCSVLSMTLMDGSDVCFKAFTTVSFSLLLREKDIVCGSKVIVKDHGFLWLRESRDGWARCAMIIKEMEWEMPPNYKMPKKFRMAKENKAANAGRVCTVLEDYKTTMIDSEILDSIKTSWVVGFTCVTNRRKQNGGALNLANSLNRLNGDFVVNDALRRRWRLEKVGTRQMTVTGKCGCITGFGMRGCLVMDMFPLGEVDMEEVQFAVGECVKGKYKVGCGEEHASPEQKRWWLRWWYDINYYQCVAVGVPLPICLQQQINACVG
jgi:hypothetical protein